MNYIAELNAFERALETVRLPANAQLLWYKLMCLANRSNWSEWIEVDNGRLAGMLGIHRNSVISARDKLIEKNFIEYQRGKGRGIGRYKIISLMHKKDASTDDLMHNNRATTCASTCASNCAEGVKKEKNQKKEIINNNIIKTKTETKNNAAAVVKAYQDNIGFVNPAIFEKICAWLDDVDESLIIYAIEQAVFNNKPNWQYINAILNNHFKAGRKTRADAENVPKTKPKEEKKSKYDFADLEKKAFQKVTQKSRYDFEEIKRRTFRNVGKEMEGDGI